MSLAPGTQVGGYEVITAIGAGGMGEVYRARDGKLNRDVALKVLPAAFTSDAERLARLKREAQVLASLNHPHIAQIYGFEDSGTVHALVLELVDGPTLADRIARGPIPRMRRSRSRSRSRRRLTGARAADCAPRPRSRPISSCGATAPSKYSISAAKAVEPAVAVVGTATLSPTITSPAMTQAGVILGTAAYMSPEQAKGARPKNRATSLQSRLRTTTRISHPMGNGWR